MSDDSREENVYMAKLAEQAERYDEVCAAPAGFPALARLIAAAGARKPTCTGFPRSRGNGTFPKIAKFARPVLFHSDGKAVRWSPQVMPAK